MEWNNCFSFVINNKSQTHLHSTFRGICDQLWKTRGTAKTETIAMHDFWKWNFLCLSCSPGAACERSTDPGRWNQKSLTRCSASGGSGDTAFPRTSDLGSGRTHTAAGGAELKNPDETKSWSYSRHPRQSLSNSCPPIHYLTSYTKLTPVKMEIWLIKLANKDTNLILLGVLLKLMFTWQASYRHSIWWEV